MVILPLGEFAVSPGEGDVEVVPPLVPELQAARMGAVAANAAP